MTTKSVVTHIKEYKYATFGVAGWILLAVKYNGQIYRGMGPFYNVQPEDHMTSEMEDVSRIDRIVRQTLKQWDGLCIIDENNVMTVPLFYEVDGYDRTPYQNGYHSTICDVRSTRGNQFATLIHLHQNAKIRRDIPWRMGDLHC